MSACLLTAMDTQKKQEPAGDTPAASDLIAFGSGQINRQTRRCFHIFNVF